MKHQTTFYLRAAITLSFSIAAIACSGRHDANQAAPAQGATTEAAPTSGGSLSIKGSDTMVILAQKWAERFMQKSAGATVQVSGGGSGTGIAALLNGTADIANASRAMKDTEKAQLRSKRQANAVEHRVAIDALAVYVHRNSRLDSISLDDLKKIYRGQITNWREIGGPNRPITLYSRENNSGTYAYFKEHVLDEEDFAASAQTLPGTAAVINAVSRDEGGIGYGGIAYAGGVRILKVKGEDGTPVEPTMQNATNGSYPLARFLFMYTAGEPTGTVKRFLDFVLSPEGQGLIENVGFYPLPTQAAAAAPSPGATAPAAAVPATPAPAATH